VALIDNGMNVARLNFSHGDHEVCVTVSVPCDIVHTIGRAVVMCVCVVIAAPAFVVVGMAASLPVLCCLLQMHGRTVASLRAACSERPGKPVRRVLTCLTPVSAPVMHAHAVYRSCTFHTRRLFVEVAHFSNWLDVHVHQVAVMLDTKGPEIRTGLLKGHGTVTLKEGQTLVVSTDYEVHMTSECPADYRLPPGSSLTEQLAWSVCTAASWRVTTRSSPARTLRCLGTSRLARTFSWLTATSFSQSWSCVRGVSALFYCGGHHSDLLACLLVCMCYVLVPPHIDSCLLPVLNCRSEIVVRVMNDFVLGEKKNMNLPGVIVDLPTITEKDRHDIAGFGLRYNVDMIAASFVRKAEDIGKMDWARRFPAPRCMC
jgi:hypothetical protein